MWAVQNLKSSAASLLLAWLQRDGLEGACARLIRHRRFQHVEILQLFIQSDQFQSVDFTPFPVDSCK